jgi:hypothetical protein
MNITDLRPGDIGFGPINGVAGLIVAVGQLMLGERARIHRRTIDHVFMVTEERYVTSEGYVTDGQLRGPLAVEAMPSGAREVDISDRWTDRYIYLRLPGMNEASSHLGWMKGERISYEARQLVGTPYSFLDYGALALRHWGFPHDSLRKRITDSGHMICSQLADQALTRAGIKVFNDGRLSQDVTPGALYYQLLRLGATTFWPE